MFARSREIAWLWAFVLGLPALVTAQNPAPPASATPASRTVDPGMTREQVIATIGQPIAARSAGPRTYLFFPNGRERREGMYDLVMLENDAVVDAIFRSPNRRYSGTSSSPNDARPVPTNVVAVPSGEMTTGAPMAAPALADPSSTTVLPSITGANAPPRASQAPASANPAATTSPAGAANDTGPRRFWYPGQTMPPQPPRTIFPTPTKPNTP